MALYNLTMNTNYFAVKAALQNNASLCIVSKYRTTEQILSYYEAGERLFAENRVSELKEKAAVLPKVCSPCGAAVTTQANRGHSIPVRLDRSKK